MMNLAQDATEGDVWRIAKYNPDKHRGYEKALAVLLKDAAKLNTETHVFLELRLPHPHSVSLVSSSQYPDFGGVIIRRVEMWNVVKNKIMGRLDYLARAK